MPEFKYNVGETVTGGEVEGKIEWCGWNSRNVPLYFVNNQWREEKDICGVTIENTEEDDGEL